MTLCCHVTLLFYSIFLFIFTRDQLALNMMCELALLGACLLLLLALWRLDAYVHNLRT